jgi:chromosomal replication initiator protein
MTAQENDEVKLASAVDEIWQQAQKILEKEKKISEAAFRCWICATKLIDVGDQEVVVAVSNEYAKSQVGTNYLSYIKEALNQVLGRQVATKLVVDATIEFDTYVPSIATISVIPQNSPTQSSPGQGEQTGGSLDNGSQASSKKRAGSGNSPGVDMPPTPREFIAQAPSSAYAFSQNRITSAGLNPEYTFDTFVVGSHDRFVHSAAMAVSERPGQTYNPLFVYGGVGLGKTHIMQAIGHQILLHSPQKTVRYTTSERLTNEFINSIRDGKNNDFRKRYRQVDVLLIDDIQFIAGKERMQEEFFHTFDELRNTGKQIVLTSDKPPKAIADLEERLRSRFEGGLLADIQPPDLETRQAILRKKSELSRIQIPDDVLEYIASIFITNVRELQGALNRIVAYSQLTNSPVSIKSATQIFQPDSAARPKVILTVEKIMDAVAAHYHVEPSDLRSEKRSQDLVLPRHIAMYLAHNLLDLSYPRIGQAFGNRQHTSVIHACNKIKDRIAEEPALASAILQLKGQLGN